MVIVPTAAPQSLELDTECYSSYSSKPASSRRNNIVCSTYLTKLSALMSGETNVSIVVALSAALNSAIPTRVQYRSGL